MVRACSATASSSKAKWSNTSPVSRTYAPVTTGSGCAPTEAIAVTSAARPPAPLGSLALNTITHAGPDVFAFGLRPARVVGWVWN